MRIALVSPYDLGLPGGVASHVLHLAEQLRAAGDEVVVIGPGRGDDPGGVVGVGRAIGVPFNQSVAPIALSPSSRRRTAEVIVGYRPDVVHVHEPTVPWVSVAAVLASPVPVVGTFHAWSERARLYRLARPATRRIVGRLAARIAVSPAARDYHASALGLVPTTFRVIPNGVDVARFHRSERLDDDPRPTLLFVGRLEPRKGLEPLIRAFALLKAQRPDVRLLVIGDGPERERCQALLPVGLRSDVVFLGRLDQDELPRAFASCDVFVAPSLGGESFGIVLIEAMAAGAAIVASDIPGYRSVITDGVEGRLVPPGDPRQLATALRALLDSEALRRSLSQAGRAAVDQYDWAAVTASVRRVYQSMVA